MTEPNTLTIIYAGNKRVGKWWNYQNIISPFNRLYYIQAGEGEVSMHGKRYKLTAGKLFLIPKFTIHSYHCSEYMDHTYVCFFDDGEPNTFMPNHEQLECLVEAEVYDSMLMNRLLELHPLKSLTYVDPHYYDNGQEKYAMEGTISERNRTESKGILLQLISRFMTGNTACKNIVSSERIAQVSHYITKHMAEPISMEDLSRIVCLSTDHFSRLFRNITGEAPSHYLRRRRVERAQHLLLTSTLPISKIAESVGIPNISQFSRLFSQMCGCSPARYREQQPELRAVKG